MTIQPQPIDTTFTVTLDLAESEPSHIHIVRPSRRQLMHSQPEPLTLEEANEELAVSEAA